VYPSVPSDAYTPQLNMTEMLGICRENSVKYLLVYENRGYYYFNSTLNAASIAEMINNTGLTPYQTSFGVQPNRVFVFEFNQTAIQT
jgi:hypothetical protein